MAEASAQLERYLSTDSKEEARGLLNILASYADSEKFRRMLIDQFATSGVTGRRRLCWLYAAIPMSDVRVKLGQCIFPGDEWSQVRQAAISGARIADAQLFLPELLWCAIHDIDPTTREAARRALATEVDLIVDDEEDWEAPLTII